MTALQHEAVEGSAAFDRLCALLEMIDDVHAGESGSIVFGGSSRGIVLVQSGRVCWASSPSVATRLSHRLRSDSAAGDRKLAAIFSECRDSGKPFGQTLVARGLVTFEALRAALLQHTAETLLQLASDPAPRWVPARIDRYDRSFTFTSAELLTHSADSWWGPLSAEARKELAAALGDRGAVGLAFLHAAGATDTIIPVGIAGAPDLNAKELLSAGRAAVSLMRSANPIGGRLVAGACADGRTFIAWLDRGVYYVVVAPLRSELAFIVAHVSRRPNP